MRHIVARLSRFAGILLLNGCLAGHMGLPAPQRPDQLVGEWVDVAKSTPADSSIWVFRADGYDGALRLTVNRDSAGHASIARNETRYGSWYLEGELGDAATQSICISRRIGRFGATCVSFSMDTVRTASSAVPRLTLINYRGQHHTGDRVLVPRGPRSEVTRPAR